MKKGIVLSGMRPTGRLHIGHLHVLNNWTNLQEDYQCYFFVADWHALTTGFDDTQDIRTNTLELVADWLCTGIDPAQSVIFLQSAVPEHAELHLLLSMITPVSWLERVPTYKDQIQQFKTGGKDIATYGFMGYPLLQAADILVYLAGYVPVGEDQLPHLELCREVARRFNHLYRPVFPEPQALLARFPLVPGVDRRKMSKSYNNEISLWSDAQTVKQRVNAMITDPDRIHKSDPGHPEICLVHTYHSIYTPGQAQELEDQCRQGGIGCSACKKILTGRLEEILAPIREKRRDLLARPGYIQDIIAEGTKKARMRASSTMELVREAMRI